MSEKKPMDADHYLTEIIEFFNGSKEINDLNYEERTSLHGKCIKYKQELYYDVYIYEDGYERYESIGD